jgi:hypothetical protein
MLLHLEILIAKVLQRHNKQLEIAIFFQNHLVHSCFVKTIPTLLEGPLQKGQPTKKIDFFFAFT